MNKGELINAVADVVSSKKEAQAAVECVLSEIVGAPERPCRLKRKWCRSLSREKP